MALEKFLRSLAKVLGGPAPPPVVTVPEFVSDSARAQAHTALLELQTHYTQAEALSLRHLGAVEFRTTHLNLDEHLAYLRLVNPFIEKNLVLTQPYLLFELKTCWLSQYFVSNDGHYISVNKIQEFCEEALSLCDNMADAELAEFGAQESNLRVLRPVFIGLKSTAQALKTVYQTRS